MKTLYVAWKDTQSAGGWFPVGRLDADIGAAYYRFRYVQGALNAAKERGFVAFDSFPDFLRQYESGELFPFFANRLQNPSRPGFREYLRRLDLDGGHEPPFEPIEVLAVSEGRRATDNLEIFPKVERTEGAQVARASPPAGSATVPVRTCFWAPFAIKFFVHGWRYLNPASSSRILKLQPGEDLSVAVEANNPATGYAIQLQTRDRMLIGYAPRYLIRDIFHVITRCAVPVLAKVSRVNHPPAPPNQRVLVWFEGCWPEGYDPMSGEEFQPLVGEREAVFAAVP